MNAGISALDERIKHAAQERDRAATSGDRLHAWQKLSGLLRVWQALGINRLEAELGLPLSRGGSL